MSFLRVSARRSFSSAAQAYGRDNPHNMFAEKFTSPAFDIISALSVAGAVTFMVNELYRKPQIEKLNAFHAKLRRCRQQGIFDRAKV